MRIQHNIMAMNSYRNYNTNTSALSKNLEKLSSGYKVNRAGDDAAGLAVSEKMRAQITGLEAAQKNVKDATNLVKTAEGAMQEIQDMLKRMKYLATESANGTFDEEVDRANLQKEVESLRTEINRIADSANFNGIKLLDGSLEAPSGTTLFKTGYAEGSMNKVTASGGAKFSATIAIASGTTADTGGLEGDAGKMDLSYLDKDGVSRSTTISFTYGSTTAETATSISNALKNVFGDGYNVTVSGTTITVENANGNEKDLTNILAAKQYNSKGQLLDDVSSTNKATPTLVAAGKDDKFAMGLAALKDDSRKHFVEIDGTRYQILERGGQVQEGYKGIYVDDIGAAAPTKETLTQIAEQLNGYGVKAEVNADGDDVELVKSNGNDGKGGMTLQIGDTADAFNQMKVAISDMHASALGIEGIDIGTQKGAAAAIEAIRQATNKVSSTRGDLGAVQNRLDHTLNNLSVMTENIQDAESTIRDTDVAEEMMAYTKNNILIQSAQAMLAQANAVPQGVLQLLG